MLSHRHNFIYLPIPKTGTTSLRSKLNKYADFSLNHHPRMSQYIEWGKQNGVGHKVIEKYYIFTFTRNPWDRWVSLYKYYVLTGGGGSVHDDRLVAKLPKCFREFTSEIHPEIWPTFNRQVNFINDDVNFLGKFENYQQDVNTIVNILNLPKISLPKYNVSISKKHYTEFYDDELKAQVAEKYGLDIEKFKYKF